ncbi:hypothetical protein WKH31_08455 [Metabacillus indicus]|uniref:hypothetical protein n=1 Tax=Metabacillus indicus TaxID=246786 RepID=UPI00316D6AA1
MVNILFHTENGKQQAADFLEILVANSNDVHSSFVLRVLDLMRDIEEFPASAEHFGEFLSTENELKANHELLKKLKPYTVPPIYELRIDYAGSVIRMFYFTIRDSFSAPFYVFTEAYEFTKEHMEKGIKNAVTEQARQRAHTIASKYKQNPDAYIRKSGGYDND